MTALAAISALKARSLRMAAALPDEPKISTQIRLLQDTFNGPGAPPPQDQLEALRQRLILACQLRNFESVTRRDWQQAAWLLWDGEQCLAADERFVAAYISAMDHIRAPSAIRRLIYVYLRDFELDRPNIVALALFIRRALALPKMKTLENWRGSQERHGLFDPERAPGNLADLILATDNDAEQVLHAAGLAGELETGGLGIAVHDMVLEKLEARLESGRVDEPTCERIFSFLSGHGGLKFPHRRVLVVHSLLRPWINHPPPSPNVKDLIRDFLLDQLLDPRVHPGHWHGVDPRALAVIRRWLAEETLEDFFRILDESALDAHWRYRRAFWLSYFARGVLDDAWIALGPHAQRYARRMFGEGVSYGKLTSGQADQSVLVLRIQGLVFVEWSHNGKCRAWPIDGRGAPTLHRPSYDRSELMIGSMKINTRYAEAGISHMSSETGHWQGILADFIKKQTNIAVTRREYMANV